MSLTYISADLRRLVTVRAGNTCEYCRIHEDDYPWAGELRSTDLSKGNIGLPVHNTTVI
jgi:hypothetical protein